MQLGTSWRIENLLTICEALEFVLNNAFRHGEKWYVQKTGVAMGTPVAPTLTNLFLAIWEEDFIYILSLIHISLP